MAKKKKTSGPKGAKQSNEPRVMAITQWGGMATKLQPAGWERQGGYQKEEQTDLVPTLLPVCHNVNVADGTLQVRNKITKIVEPPAGLTFTGVSYQWNSWQFFAVKKSDGDEALYFWQPGRTITELPTIKPAGSKMKITQVSIYNKRLMMFTELSQSGTTKAVMLVGDISNFPYKVGSSDYMELAIPPKVINADANNQNYVPNVNFPNADASVTDLAPDDGWGSASSTISNVRPTVVPIGKIKHNRCHTGKTGTYLSSSAAPVKLTFVFVYTDDYGQTTRSAGTTIYMDTTPAEFTGSKYLEIQSPQFTGTPSGGTVSAGRNEPGWFWQSLSTVPTKRHVVRMPTGATGVDVYYKMNDALDYVFAGRATVTTAGDTPIFWSLKWKGGSQSTKNWVNSSLIIPDENTTGGVSARYFLEKDGRFYFWGDMSKQARLYIGGGIGNEISVSRGLGGGYIDYGGSTSYDVLKSVHRFETYNGSTIMTALFDNPNNGRTSRANVVETNLSLTNEVSSKSWMFEEVEGVTGTCTVHGSGVYYDGLYYINRYGLGLTTKAMESQNQLRTDYASENIENLWTDMRGGDLNESMLIGINDQLYMSFGGNFTGKGDLARDLVFQYSIKDRTWVTHDAGVQPLSFVHIDGTTSPTEGLGIISSTGVYLLPINSSEPKNDPAVPVMIKTGELTFKSPMQSTAYVAQLEFRFDYFQGELDIDLYGVDYYGRDIHVKKIISSDSLQYSFRDWMRVDLYLESFRLEISGNADFRLTHFLEKYYQQSNNVGMVYGYNDAVLRRKDGVWKPIHHLLESYNNLKSSLIP